MIKLNKRIDKILKAYVIDDIQSKIQVMVCMTSSIYDFTDKEKTLITQAILDGEWEVEEQLYYVKLIDRESGYLNVGKNSGSRSLSTKFENITYKTKFTRAEAIAIDPRYLEFLEEVE